jgi:hypothetical protein
MVVSAQNRRRDRCSMSSTSRMVRSSAALDGHCRFAIGFNVGTCLNPKRGGSAAAHLPRSATFELHRQTLDVTLGRRSKNASVVRIDSVEPMLACADQVNRIGTAKQHLR